VEALKGDHPGWQSGEGGKNGDDKCINEGDKAALSYLTFSRLMGSGKIAPGADN